MVAKNGVAFARGVFCRKLLGVGLLLCFAFALAACIEKTVISGPGVVTRPSKTVQVPPEPPSAPPPSVEGQVVRGATSYTVLGQTYKPMLSGGGYSEEGLASWYGPDFHDKLTASGERYDMYAMTAAHKVLPFGSMVRVTSLENGKSVVVRINDRGPFVGNRIIDLSKAAAEQMGMTEKGTMLVRVETVGEVPGLDNGDMRGSFYVQVGAFGKESNAAGLARSLQDRSFKVRNYYSAQVNMWRVQIGPYSALSSAVDSAEALRGEFAGSYIVAD
jgi:rare lipoprotein A